MINIDNYSNSFRQSTDSCTLASTIVGLKYYDPSITHEEIFENFWQVFRADVPENEIQNYFDSQKEIHFQQTGLELWYPEFRYLCILEVVLDRYKHLSGMKVVADFLENTNYFKIVSLRSKLKFEYLETSQHFDKIDKILELEDALLVASEKLPNNHYHVSTFAISQPGLISSLDTNQPNKVCFQKKEILLHLGDGILISPKN